ncbi:hypothetical protein CCHR01_16732 [Colletotrichum chrysophilum]|uniref:Secreted protein n=1 Tax=Colletotrichum chrysophilum TaxID=1836956 RepID=A0AAD9A3Q6_9PEZI|nr:hypothetical protein CCHR01_16732 [Colletotrichum chrysophilum]
MPPFSSSVAFALFRGAFQALLLSCRRRQTVKEAFSALLYSFNPQCTCYQANTSQLEKRSRSRRNFPPRVGYGGHIAISQRRAFVDSFTLPNQLTVPYEQPRFTDTEWLQPLRRSISVASEAETADFRHVKARLPIVLCLRMAMAL